MAGSAAIGNLAVNLSMETAAFTAGATKAQSELRNLSGAARGFSVSGNNARIVGLELAHVTRSMGEQIAMGVSPMRALTMEMGRLATAAQYAGGPAGLVKMAVGLAAAHPVLLALAGAAAIGAGALAALKSSMNASGEIDNYVKGLGLTEAQINKLKDASVSYGDIMKGVWKTVADHTSADEGIAGFKTFAIGQFKQFLHDGVTIFANLYGDIVGGYRAMVVIWKTFPAALGDAFYSGVNAAIRAINSLLEKSVSGINSFIGSANGILGKFGFSIPTITAPHIAAVANQYAGAAKTVATAFSAETAKAAGQARRAANAIIAETERNILDATEHRISAEVGANDKSAGGHEKAARAAQHHTDELKKLRDTLAEVSDELLKQGPLLAEASNAILDSSVDNAIGSFDDQLAEMQKRQQQILSFADQFGAAIASAVTGTESLKRAFSDMATSILSQIIQMSVRMLIFRAIAGIFKMPDVGVGQFNATNPGVGFANGGSFEVGGFGGIDQNILSVNGSPVARVSKGEAVSVSNDNVKSGGSPIIVKQYNNFAGGAVTRDDLVRMHAVTVAGAQKAVDERNRRAG